MAVTSAIELTKNTKLHTQVRITELIHYNSGSSPSLTKYLQHQYISERMAAENGSIVAV